MSPHSTLAAIRALGQRRLVRWFLAAAGACGLALCLFSPTQELLEPTLDSSNYGSYAWFTAREYQYGKEIVPMVGPLGFVPYGHVYAGHLFEERLLLEVLTKLALGAMLVWFFRRAGPGWVRWVWLGSVLFMAPSITDLPYGLASLFAGLCLLDTGARHRRPWVDLALAALLALLTLFKGTQTQMSLLVLVLSVAQATLQRDLRRAARLLVSYMAALVLLMLAAGQNPLNFPAYLQGVFELSSGYNNAMGVNETQPNFLAGIGVFTAILLLAGATLAAVWRDRAKALGILLLLAFTFIQWKHGFVRADGHIYVFFDYACIAAPTLWLLAFRPSSTPRPPWLFRLCGGLAVGSTLFAHWAIDWSSPARHWWLLHKVPARVAATGRQITAPAGTKADLARRLDSNRKWFELPTVKDRVGTASIDFYGTNHGFLLLNRLNYRPRPMGGGAFNVYSPWLLDRNLAAVTNPATRPHFFLVEAATIDDRFLAQDDSTTLRALLGSYRPIDSEQGMVLFEDIGQAELPAPRLLAQQTISLDQKIQPPTVRPDEFLAVEFDLPLTVLGRVRALLYKPPMVFLDLKGDGIALPLQRRVVPAMFARPVPFSPVIEDTADLVSLFTEAPGKQVQELRLHAEEPSLFAHESLAVRFYALPRPAPAPAAASVLRRLAFRASSWLPSEKDAPGSHLRRIGGMPVRVIDAPGRIRYPLAGKEHSVQFIFGVDPEAFVRGHTDGVEFFVDLERPGQPAQPLFSRLLKPMTRPDDRSFQVERLVLPPHPAGSVLILRTGIGPDNDGAWDWGYFAGVSCGEGDFVPEQFPGFAHLPSTVTADNCGAYVHDGRPLFLLNPPGRMTFVLTGTETALEFQAGLLPGAYSNGGNSDGVGLRIELEEAASATRTLLTQVLNPRDRAEDRGSRRIHVPLPAPAPGTRLNLVIDPGPANNGSWDWSYIEGLRFE